MVIILNIKANNPGEIHHFWPFSASKRHVKGTSFKSGFMARLSWGKGHFHQHQGHNFILDNERMELMPRLVLYLQNFTATSGAREHFQGQATVAQSEKRPNFKGKV